jgi:hypothetical protein
LFNLLEELLILIRIQSALRFRTTMIVRCLALVLLVSAAGFSLGEPPAKPAASSDVIVFTNGDRLTGKLLRVIGQTVTFHSDLAGDINVTWDKISELTSSSPFAVLEKNVIPKRKLDEAGTPIGSLKFSGKDIQLESATSTAAIPPLPVADVAYVIDQPSFDKQLRKEPGFLEAWNGSVTAGVTLVQATQNQYTFSGAAGLVRAVPSVSWLPPRNRTAVDFAGSYGKITQPGYTPPGMAPVPASYTKTNIEHADAERDEYFSPRFYYLADLALDHNYAQDLSLQQIYGAGIGLTVFKTPKHQLDTKIAAQYEKQQFGDDAAAGTNQNLIGATLAANYTATILKKLKFNQQLSYIPAFNNVRAYSANEEDTLAFPTWKNLSFTVGTLDSYLNDTPLTVPPTKRNSFQFTMGLTYNVKSKY